VIKEYVAGGGMKPGKENLSSRRMIFWAPQIHMTTTGFEAGPQRITLADTIIIIIIIYCTTTITTTTSTKLKTRFMTDPSLHLFLPEEMRSP
jgi:hypothetical protein